MQFFPPSEKPIDNEVIIEIKSNPLYSENFYDSPGLFGHIAMPMVMRVFSSLVSQDLVSVQPMQALKGELFYLDYKFNETPRQDGEIVRYVASVDPYQDNTGIPKWNDSIMT